MIATLPAITPQAAVTSQAAVTYEILGPDAACNDAGSSTGIRDAQRWLRILRDSMQHQPYCVRAVRSSNVVGLLPLAYVKSSLFGRFLVSLPYVNSAGVISDDPEVSAELVDRAVQLADQLQVRYLELRQEQELTHSALSAANRSKVLMRLPLPATTDELWTGFKAKLRSQVKSGQKHNFEVNWGAQELLPDFYSVFSQNMRDLGTPVYSQRLFACILREFAGDAELCVLRRDGQAVAGAIIVHYADRTEVPSASSLRAVNSTNANMVMYWELLKRAVERGQRLFDFGRSSVDSGTYRFKEQWGAQPHPSVWQYHLRQGKPSDMRPDNKKFGLAIRVWRKLPVAVTRIIGPSIVRGIP